MTLPFENDTGPVIKKLASRSIQTDKRRNLFVIVTIALAAALMAAIFCAGAGSDRKLEADIRGQYQAVVVNCDRDTIERLKDCPEVERWGLSQNYGSARYGDSVLTVEYADANWMELGKKPSFTGTLPQAANEILVERAFLDYFEIPAEVGLNSTPFVRQYDILSKKWGVLLCQKEYQTNDIRRSSREWL